MQYGFSGIFLASSFPCFQALSTAAPPPVMQAISPLILFNSRCERKDGLCLLLHRSLLTQKKCLYRNLNQTFLLIQFMLLSRAKPLSSENTYSFARLLSIVLFFVGIALLVTSIVLRFFKNNVVLTLFFGGLGVVNIIALFLDRPIERIQSGVDALIKSQIACISFAAQYDIFMRASANNSKINYDTR